MAEGKKSFVLYADLISNIDHLTNEEKGILFQHLLEYVNDMNPVLEDRVILSAWKFIQSQLKRDLVKFEETKEKRSEAGKRSAEVRALKKAQQISTNPTSVKSVQQSSTNPTVNDNVNENDNVIYKAKEFLEDWNLARTHFTGTQSNFNKLKQDEQTDFKDALNNFKKEEIQNGMKGLFMQEYVPQDIMQFRPKHFLKNIDTYLDAFNNKKKNLYKE